MKTFFLFFISCLFPHLSPASDDHELIRRVVVFPVATSVDFAKAADNTWWKMRQTLTEKKRFLVATKSFMEQKDVYQPRTKLSPPDSILLGRLLDAHALIVTSLEKRKLTFTAYSGKNGFQLWQQKMHLHPSLPVSRQLEKATNTLLIGFINSIPYQGFQIVDPLIGRPVYEEGDVQLAKVDVGLSKNMAPGDPVQWVQISRVNSKPLFTHGGKIHVVGEGSVIKNDSGVLTVQVSRVKDLNLIAKDSLVRFPKESKRLEAELSKSVKSLDIVKTPMSESRTKAQKNKPLIAALVSIANIAALILLAF